MYVYISGEWKADVSIDTAQSRIRSMSKFFELETYPTGVLSSPYNIGHLPGLWTEGLVLMDFEDRVNG